MTNEEQNCPFLNILVFNPITFYEDNLVATWNFHHRGKSSCSNKLWIKTFNFPDEHQTVSYLFKFLFVDRFYLQDNDCHHSTIRSTGQDTKIKLALTRSFRARKKPVMVSSSHPQDSGIIYRLQTIFLSCYYRKIVQIAAKWFVNLLFKRKK